MALIPSDKEYEDCKEQFLNTFMPLVERFYQIQKSKFSKQTAQNYFIIASTWIEFIHLQTGCLKYKDISVSETNSKFWAATRYNELYDFDNKEVKSKLKVFVDFLSDKGYENPKVTKALAKK